MNVTLEHDGGRVWTIVYSAKTLLFGQWFGDSPPWAPWRPISRESVVARVLQKARKLCGAFVLGFLNVRFLGRFYVEFNGWCGCQRAAATTRRFAASEAERVDGSVGGD